MGPLAGFRIIEVGGIGPAQLCGMLLADMGADVLRIERSDKPDLGIGMPARFNLMNRSRPAIAIDIRSDNGKALLLKLCESADALFEGFRPGVMERLGLGPRECMARNEKLVFGRMTGWGQDGPLADAVGHDTNYIALTGALHSMGDADRPPPIPLNLIGDFGGGALYLAMGMLAAMLESTRSGRGQVVDAAMVDGVSSMLTMFHGLQAGGLWSKHRHQNLLDGGAPFVRNYETADGQYMSVCAIENRFFRALLESLGIDEIDPKEQYNPARWEAFGEIFAARFASKTRDEWSDILEGTDACSAPVLSMSEACHHPHNEARNAFVTVENVRQPAPAPRFSRTTSTIRHGPRTAAEFDPQTLTDWGFSRDEIATLLATGAISVGQEKERSAV